jgi:[acyl-carrier-protein] S-malonyltransferase
MNNKAILFPAFVREYCGFEKKHVESYLPGFHSRLKIASNINETDLSTLDFESNNFLSDELKSQYISYIFSCELADFIKKSNIKFDLTAGYSMGIYAMFYYSGSISFDDGLRIIKKAFESVTETIQPNVYGMCNIIGLSLTDINLILQNNEAEIININGSHNFVISGKIPSLQSIIERAKLEGAIHTRLLNVGCPYHSKVIRETVSDFRTFLNNLEIKDPQLPIISCIDQREIMDSKAVRDELLNNLISPLNWLETVLKLNKKGITTFYECGAGISLFKLNKFVPVDQKTYKFYELGKVQDL